MIGIWSSYADIYLIVAGIAMLVAFGIPLVFVPLQWARVFRWDVTHPENLLIFLGRSLGVFISVLALYSFKVSQTPDAMPFYYELMLWTFGGMLLLHILWSYPQSPANHRDPGDWFVDHPGAHHPGFLSSLNQSPR